MSSKNQFFETVKSVISVICPAVRYDQGKNHINQSVISVKDEDENVTYVFRFNSIENSIIFKMEVVVDDEKPRTKEINWKIGSKSVKDIVNQIRDEKINLQKNGDSPFAILNKLRK